MDRGGICRWDKGCTLGVKDDVAVLINRLKSSFRIMLTNEEGDEDLKMVNGSRQWMFVLRRWDIVVCRWQCLYLTL